MIWEYLYQESPTDNTSFQTMLTSIGNSGWELVTVQERLVTTQGRWKESTKIWCLFFKRPKGER